MKKLLFVLTVFCAISCDRNTPTPIEKYSRGKYVITQKDVFFKNNVDLRLKNADTIFWITCLKFDADKYKVGDTIR